MLAARNFSLSLAALLVLSFLCLLVLSQVYQAAFSLFSGPTWLAALTLNSFLATLSIVTGWCGRISPRSSYLLTGGVLTLLGFWVLAFVSLVPEHGTKLAPGPLAWQLIGSIVFVPLAEEVLFRGALTNILFHYSLAPRWLVSYLSALTFSLLHQQISFNMLRDGALLVPIGPFILGLLCEYLTVRSGSLFYAVCAHGISNALVACLAAKFPEMTAATISWLYQLF